VCKCCFTVRGLIFNWPAISFSKARPSPILRIPRRRPLRPVVMGTQGHEPGFSGELQDTCVRLAEFHNGPTTRPMSRYSAANGAFGSRSKAGNRVICPSRQASSGPEPIPDLGLGHEAKEVTSPVLSCGFTVRRSSTWASSWAGNTVHAGTDMRLD
jgi:hypothetical protein